MQQGSTDHTTTRPVVVLPFYGYAALSFLAATIFLLFYPVEAGSFYFTPKILAIVHLMALGWGTMIIIGSGYQLVPVLSEQKLYGEGLARASFYPAAAGIALLIYGFFHFNMGWPAQAGGILINLSVLTFVFIVYKSVAARKQSNVHMVFLFTASFWLLITTVIGTLLVYNFTGRILSADSLHYLSLHAHLGIAGWFLLTIFGVGSKLIPMFMISGYHNDRLLWIIYLAINAALLAFILIFFLQPSVYWYFIPLLLIASAVIVFAVYCIQAFRKRIRKSLDRQVKLSVGTVGFMVLPLVLLSAILILSGSGKMAGRIYLMYGFTVFFGWITSIILGMTFKTLPFIIWNRLSVGRTGMPLPKTLFHQGIFNSMQLAYLGGFILFIAGLGAASLPLIKTGSVFLLFTAVFYNLNVWKMVLMKKAA